MSVEHLTVVLSPRADEGFTFLDPCPTARRIFSMFCIPIYVQSLISSLVDLLYQCVSYSVLPSRVSNVCLLTPLIKANRSHPNSLTLVSSGGNL